MRAYLHSTMFLLIQCTLFFLINPNLIYIPLCFYLYCCSVLWQHFCQYIYIPLCFYLYRARTNEYCHLLYNLHSTMFLLIPNESTSTFTVTKFTFHYVSTYTFYIRSACRCMAAFTFHYVSTYTEFCNLYIARPFRFTFHYVSTYT